ncbi:hypothetical protein WJX72_006168 [[Myrmecia] bisecta]|uniref:Uncharacterized protein n=1 Tax=[Myrmecia] bisecta TaxID=41462 RepID=A0AAW1R6R9_9CHLO
MQGISVILFRGTEQLATKHFRGPAKAVDIRQGLQDTNATWIGVLTEAGDPGHLGLVGHTELTAGVNLQEHPEPAAAAHLLTLYEVVTYPVPQLTKALSPSPSASKTQPSQPRTFSDILPWLEFIPGCQESLRNLDNSERIYHAPLSGRIRPGAFRPAADEGEVRGRVLSLLDSINDVAEVLGIPVECTGGGSGGRSSSFTDLVVRLTGSPTDPAHLSALILGPARVKGDWQFNLERGETLEAALHDPERIAETVLAVQQVYGDAVFDEAPMLILTNYHVTVFLKRSADVQDKRLWASPPICGSALPADPVLPLADLGITDELLGAGQSGHVLQGSYCMQPVAVKLYNLQSTAASCVWLTWEARSSEASQAQRTAEQKRLALLLA